MKIPEISIYIASHHVIFATFSQSRCYMVYGICICLLRNFHRILNFIQLFLSIFLSDPTRLRSTFYLSWIHTSPSSLLFHFMYHFFVKRLLLYTFPHCILQFCSPFYRCYHNYRNIILFVFFLVLLRSPYSWDKRLSLALHNSVQCNAVQCCAVCTWRTVNFLRSIIRNKLKFVHTYKIEEIEESARWNKQEKSKNNAMPLRTDTKNIHTYIYVSKAMHKMNASKRRRRKKDFWQFFYSF